MKKSRADEVLRFSELGLNVLGYEEAGQWVAIALEMDVRGYGRTFERAVSDLHDLVIMQISFAFFKGQPQMIFKPAEPIWFQRFAELRAQRFNALGREPEGEEFQIADLPLPSPATIAKYQTEYSPVDA